MSPASRQPVAVGLRIDVDTLRGTQRGVPGLLEVLRRHRVSGSFYFSVGPDNMGRNLWRLLKPAFLWKMLRSNAASLYGWDILLRGTFWPGPVIARRAGGEIAAAAAAGHEIGFHAWDHYRWQTRVERFSPAQLRDSMERGIAALQALTGQRVGTSAVAGWRATEAALLAKQAVGFDYNSDCRGHGPFIPVVDGRELALQLPVTLPTYDEVIGTAGVDDASYNAHILGAIKPGALNVYTIHAEVEGVARVELFDDLLTTAAQRGIVFQPLRQLVAGIDRAALPRCGIDLPPLPGRGGWITWQGPAL